MLTSAPKTMQDDTEESLLERSRGGDPKALEELLGRHQAQIYRFGMKLCRNPDDAADVVQETLLAMARGIRDFRGASSLSTWLFTVARSHCIKKRRRSKFAPSGEASLEQEGAREAHGLADHAKHPDEALAGREIEVALERAIGKLDPMYREVLVLRDGEGLTAPEVAEVLGLSVQAVKTRLHRARLAVREELAPLMDVPEASAPTGMCPDVLTTFSRHLEGEIDSDVCSAMEKHLDACPRCRGACDSLRRTLLLCRTAASDVEVPLAVQRSVRHALRDFLTQES